VVAHGCLRKRTAAVHSEVRVEAMACSGAGDEVVACFLAGIENVQMAAVARWFLGRQKSEREHVDEKLLSVVRESVGPAILVHGT
jgi:hypothetical protein